MPNWKPQIFMAFLTFLILLIQFAWQYKSKQKDEIFLLTNTRTK